LRSNPGHRTWISRPVVIVASVVILAAAGAVAAWRLTQPDTLRRIPATVSAPSPPAATLPRASCGSAVTHKLAGDTEILRADPGALTCFSTAAGGCRAATIKVVDMGVDTGTDYVFTIDPGGTGCLVLEQSQDYSANFGGSTGPITATSCQRSAVNRNGVVLRCNKLDVLIPATVTVPRG
jgi:hypothetical protein